MTLYQLFDLPENVSQQELRSTYKKLVKRCHPDKIKNDKSAEERFKIISNAYSILGDEYKRSLYDQKLQADRYSKTYSVGTYDDYSYQYGKKDSYDFASERAKDLEVDRKTNLWLVVALIFVSILTYTGPKVMDYLDAEELKEIAQRKLATQEQIIASVQSHKIKEGLSLLTEYKEQYPNDFASINMENTLFKFVDMESAQLLKKKDYASIIPLVEPLLSYELDISSSYYFLLAEAYAHKGDFGRSGMILNQLLSSQPKNLRALEQLARLNLFPENHHPKLALNYYDSACNVVINNYQEVYGAAYIMLLNPNELPEIHSRVFVGRAQALYNLGEYDLAKNDCNWVQWIRPDFKQNTELLANIERKLRADQNKHRLASIQN